MFRPCREYSPMQLPFNIFRSWKSDCWKGDLEDALSVYTDRELSEIQDHGFNGIWLHQKLSDYTLSKIFPEFGRESGRYIETLEKLIERAAKRGISVYLYLLEPRALLASDLFWKAHPELAGQYWLQPVYELEYRALCSSHSQVRDYLHDSMEKVTRRLEGLGGYIAITAGEDFSTCHGKLWAKSSRRRAIKDSPQRPMDYEVNCPRCQHRPASETISETLNALHAGVAAAGQGSRFLAWDWAWDHLPPDSRTEQRIVETLHPEIVILSDFEIGGSKEVLGKKRHVDEYSLGYVGPSPRFQKKQRFAEANGRQIAAKLQIGTTHELCTVPNLPLIHHLAQKSAYLRKHKISGALSTWNMGNMRTLNTYLFGKMLGSPVPIHDKRGYLEIAQAYLGVSESEIKILAKAWTHFERAMRFYPYGGRQFLYFGPINYAPAYWLPPRLVQNRPLGLSSDVMERGDSLGRCLGEYTTNELIKMFGALAAEWEKGLRLYRAVHSTNDAERVAEEERSAVAAWHVFRSTRHIFQAFELCVEWNEDRHRDVYTAICGQEEENCLELLEILKCDPRIGFHPECQQMMFDETMVLKKIGMLRSYQTNDGLAAPREEGVYAFSR